MNKNSVVLIDKPILPKTCMKSTQLLLPSGDNFVVSYDPLGTDCNSRNVFLGAIDSSILDLKSIVTEALDCP